MRTSCWPNELDDDSSNESGKRKSQRSAYSCQERRRQTSSNKMNLKLSYFLTVICVPMLAYLNSINLENEKPRLLNSLFVHSQELGDNTQDGFWSRATRPTGRNNEASDNDASGKLT